MATDLPRKIRAPYRSSLDCMFQFLVAHRGHPGSYALLANRIGGTLTATTSPVPVTLSIGDNSGSTQMNARFN